MSDSPVLLLRKEAVVGRLTGDLNGVMARQHPLPAFTGKKQRQADRVDSVDRLGGGRRANASKIAGFLKIFRSDIHMSLALMLLG